MTATHTVTRSIPTSLVPPPAVRRPARPAWAVASASLPGAPAGSLVIAEPARLAGGLTTDGKDFVARCHDVTETPRHALPDDGADWSGAVSLHQVLTHLERRHGLPSRLFAGGPSLGSFDAGRDEHVATVRAWYSWLSLTARSTHHPDDALGQLDAFDAATEVARGEGWQTMRGHVADHAVDELPYEMALRVRRAPVQVHLGIHDDSVRGTLRPARHRFATVVAVAGTRRSGEAELTVVDPTVSSRAETVLVREVMVTLRDGDRLSEQTAWRVTGSTSYDRPTLVRGFSWFDAAKPGR